GGDGRGYRTRMGASVSRGVDPAQASEAVAARVPGRAGARSPPAAEVVRGGREGAVAEAVGGGVRAVSGVGRDQIEFAVAGEVRQRHGGDPFGVVQVDLDGRVKGDGGHLPDLQRLQAQTGPGPGLADGAGSAGGEQLAKPGTDGHGTSPVRENGPRRKKGSASLAPTIGARQVRHYLPLSQPRLLVPSMRNGERNHATPFFAFSGGDESVRRWRGRSPQRRRR